jgi:thiamine monophosphate kinase
MRERKQIMKRNEFRIDVTEKKQEQLLEYMNDMQEAVDMNRNGGNDYAFMTSMHYRDGFLRALTILGIEYDMIERELEGVNHTTFTRLKKDIYRD